MPSSQQRMIKHSKTRQRRRHPCGDNNSKWLCKLLPVGLGLIYGTLIVVTRRQLTQRLHLEESSSSLVLSREAFRQQFQPPPRVFVFTNLQRAGETRRHQLQGTENNLWYASPLIPPWMKDYFSMHQQQRALITPDNWHRNNVTYLVMQCSKFDVKCGGAADRLKPTPMIIMLAAQMKRLLFIHWEKPARLEEFLVPPKGGIDWRIPDYMIPHIGWTQFPIRNPVGMLHRMMNDTSTTTIHVRYQSCNSGAEFYDTHKPPGTYNFSEIYHHVWKVLFTPNPVIAHLVQDLLEQWGLEPYQYASIHLRAHYGVEFQKREDEYIEEWTPNSLHCASLVPVDHFILRRIPIMPLHWPNAMVDNDELW